jgi:hypothetical protein
VCTTDPASPDVYAEICLRQAPRVIAAIDRNPLSATYGCCDWRYWHDKVTDIPSGHDLEMVYFLALLYTTEFKDNVYFRHPFVLALAKAVLGFWCRSLSRAGALDEFYPNESQYGATAIVAWAVAETVTLLCGNFDSSEEDRVLTALERTGRWLAANDEWTNLANHQAQAMLALYRIHELTKIRRFHDGYLRKRNRLFSLYHREGWFEEYGQFDPGYQTTCLSFLIRLHESTRDAELLEVIVNCLDHLKYCVMPNNRFGAELGSRKTRHVWPSTFEYLAKSCPTAASLARYYRAALASGRTHDPRIQDRYFVQQLYDYLWAFRAAGRWLIAGEPLPFWGAPFFKYFPESGLVAVKNDNAQCMAINVRKGGTFIYCKVADDGSIVEQQADAGIAIVTRSGGVLTSDFGADSSLATVEQARNNVRIETKGRFHFTRFVHPGRFSFIAFRLVALLLMHHDLLRRLFRYGLACLLVTHRRAGPHGFTRMIEISPAAITIADRVTATATRSHAILQVIYGIDAAVIYVPISKAFDLSDMAVPTVIHDSAPGDSRRDLLLT